MSAKANVRSVDLEQPLIEEIHDLRRNMLRGFAAAGMVITWGWYVYCLWESFHFGPASAVALISFTMLLIAHLCRSRFLHVSSYLFCLALTFLFSALVFTFPYPIMMAAGAVVIVATCSLLGVWTAFGAACWVYIAALTAARWAGHSPLTSTAMGLAGLYVLVWGAAALASYPMTASVAWALTGWEEARRALTQTQARRAELYRTLRALEEATFRIEQMNRELINARREAELARAQKAQFATTVSHELRGPLSLILGFSRVMALTPERYGAPLPEPYWEDIDAIYRSSQHLSTLVDDVLDLAQIDADHLPLVKDQIDLNIDIVQKAVEIVRPLAERRGLTLRTELADNLPVLIADPVRLRQALLNLLINAVRFTKQGSVTVHTALSADATLVSVEDTGPGIPSSQLSKLFSEFSSVHVLDEETSETKGSGLGLSISKQLIELHGGHIAVESEEGLGTTVQFSIPLPGYLQIGQALLRTRDRRREAIESQVCLLVHDDPGAARLLARHLEGYRVVAVRQEGEVAFLVHDLHPQAIITTPKWRRRVQRVLDTTTYEIPVISCSLPHSSDSLPDGVFAYLVKPVNPEFLNSVMRQVNAKDKTTVLIIDDDPDVVRLMELMLTAMPRPYRILHAYDGEEAWRQMAETVPDIVFLDLLMPGLSGHEVLTRMRADRRLSHVPVVIVSAQDQTDEPNTIGTPMVLTYRTGLDVGAAMRCLRALIEAVHPRYLPAPEPL